LIDGFTGSAGVKLAVSGATVVSAVALVQAIVAVEPTGLDVTAAATVTMFCSEISTTPKATVTTVEAATVALVESAVAPVAVVIPVITEVSTSSPGAAFAGATVNIPKPREATATSAMRLKVVFVDICFLSISRSREFPPVGFG
jgi:hypothetical protein